MRILHLSLFFLLALVVHVRAKDVISFALVGGTSNLAQKYLWQSIFTSTRISTNATGIDYQVTGSGTKPSNLVANSMKNTMDESINCDNDHAGFQRCLVDKRRFLLSTRYFKLRDEYDYGALCRLFETDATRDRKSEVGRIFYLSVSPKLYPSITRSIAQNCMDFPGDIAKPTVKIVYEKPFGESLESCRSLFQSIQEALDESSAIREGKVEVHTLLVDHYLGKEGVQAIIPFRRQNKKLLSSLLEQERVGRVEVEFKETESLVGRTSFFDHYGIVRDIASNHLTSLVTPLMTTLAPAEPSSSAFTFGTEEARKRVLKGLKPKSLSALAYGQYEGYREEVRKEGGSEASTTATAAVSELTSQDKESPFYQVPIVFKAGKALDERRCTLTLHLKNSDSLIQFHIQGAKASKEGEQEDETPKHLPLFWPHLEEEGLALFDKTKPYIFLSVEKWSTHFVKTAQKEAFDGVSQLLYSTSLDGWTQIPLKRSKYHHYALLQPVIDGPSPSAYTTILQALLSDQHDLFLSMEEAEMQWKAWNPLFDFESDAPLLDYERGSSSVFDRLQQAMEQREAKEIETAHRRIQEKEESREQEL